MDIDEFLDRELQSGMDTEKLSEPSKKPKEIDFGAEISTLTANIRTYLKEKQFDLVEKTFISLWNSLGTRKFVWDKKLHDELLSISFELSNEFGPVFQDFKSQSQVIRQMIGNARVLIQGNKHKDAMKVYSEVYSMVEGLPNILFAEKRALEIEVLRLYRDIHNTIGTSTVNKVQLLDKDITQRLARIRPILLSGNIDSASSMYLEALKLYNQIPFGFLQEKLRLGKDLLHMYKSLSIQLEINRLRGQLDPHSQKRLGKNPAYHHFKAPQVNEKEEDNSPTAARRQMSFAFKKR